MARPRVTQPTDTALSRFWQRIVDRLPLVSYGRLRRVENQNARLWDENRGLERRNYELRQDIMAMMVPIPSKIKRIDAFAEEDHLHKDRFIESLQVSFKELWIATSCEGSVKRSDLSEETIGVMQRHAKAIAQEHADMLAETIFEISLKQRARR